MPKRGTQIRFGSRVDTVHGERGLVSVLEPDGVRVWIYQSDNVYAIGITRKLAYTEVVTLPHWDIIGDCLSAFHRD